MKRYVLTGAPGGGKTVLIRALEMGGFRVVEEAATSLIALDQAQGKDQPWEEPDFLDRIVRLQRQRRAQCDAAEVGVQFHDRSPICTLALAKYLGRSPSQGLLEEVQRVTTDGTFSNPVFFIENLGFCQQTEARRISFEDTLRFEQVHRETYQELGFALFSVPPGSVPDRTRAILDHLRWESKGLDSAEFWPPRSCHPFAGGGAPGGPCVTPDDFLHFWPQAA